VGLFDRLREGNVEGRQEQLRGYLVEMKMEIWETKEMGGLYAEGGSFWSAEGKKKGQREKAGIGEKGVLVPWSGVCGSVLMAEKKMQGSSGRLKGEGRASLGGDSFFFFKGGCAAGWIKKGWV
jgi:hypothetical protein